MTLEIYKHVRTVMNFNCSQEICVVIYSTVMINNAVDYNSAHPNIKIWDAVVGVSRLPYFGPV
jgi:hypothetical protein